MANNRPKMPVAQRAKQFMPFAAVTGLDSALRKKEHELGLVQRREVMDEDAAEINSMLSIIEKGDEVTIDYYSSSGAGAGEYLTASGIVAAVDMAAHMVILENRMGANRKSEIIEIDIDDIAGIRTDGNGEWR